MGSDNKLEGETLRIAQKMLRDVTSIFEKHGIRYFLDAGTLLGVVRDQRLLPWDDDIDLATTEEYEEKILSLKHQLALKGYRLRVKRYERDTGPFKAGSIRILKVATRRMLLFNGHRLMDLHIKRRIGDELCWTEGSKKVVLKSIPKRFYDETAQLDFNGKSYTVPRDYEELLEYHYGQDWRTPVREWHFLDDDRCSKSVIT